MSVAKRAKALQQALDECGGPSALAAFISERFDHITPQAVSKWRECPARRVRQVEAAVKAKRGKIRARDLCPDIFERAA